MDTIKVLDQLELLVEESKKFMGFVRLDEDEFFMLTSKLRASLPEDVRRAGKLAENTDRIMEAAQSESERILSEAREEASRMLESARAESNRLIAEAQEDGQRAVEEAKGMSMALTDQSEITRLATAQAEGIVAQAEAEGREIRAVAEHDARSIRSGADAYARDVLVTLENQVQGAMGMLDEKMNMTLAQIQRGRRALEHDSVPGNSEGDPPVGTGRNGYHSSTDGVVTAGRGNGR